MMKYALVLTISLLSASALAVQVQQQFPSDQELDLHSTTEQETTSPGHVYNQAGTAAAVSDKSLDVLRKLPADTSEAHSIESGAEDKFVIFRIGQKTVKSR